MKVIILYDKKKRTTKKTPIDRKIARGGADAIDRQIRLMSLERGSERYLKIRDEVFAIYKDVMVECDFCKSLLSR